MEATRLLTQPPAFSSNGSGSTNSVIHVFASSSAALILGLSGPKRGGAQTWQCNLLLNLGYLHDNTAYYGIGILAGLEVQE